MDNPEGDVHRDVNNADNAAHNEHDNQAHNQDIVTPNQGVNQEVILSHQADGNPDDQEGTENQPKRCMIMQLPDETLLKIAQLAHGRYFHPFDAINYIAANNETVRNMRLTCRRLSNIGGEVLFREVFVTLNTTSMQRFIYLSSSTLSHHVRTVNIQTRTTDNYSAMNPLNFANSASVEFSSNVGAARDRGNPIIQERLSQAEEDASSEDSHTATVGPHDDLGLDLPDGARIGSNEEHSLNRMVANCTTQMARFEGLTLEEMLNHDGAPEYFKELLRNFKRYERRHVSRVQRLMEHDTYDKVGKAIARLQGLRVVRFLDVGAFPDRVPENEPTLYDVVENPDLLFRRHRMRLLRGATTGSNPHTDTRDVSDAFLQRITFHSLIVERLGVTIEEFEGNPPLGLGYISYTLNEYKQIYYDLLEAGFSDDDSSDEDGPSNEE
ncbi:hypothetical protein GGS20DRAFT_594465 [Poronia punctata]|nr:hypothetical protein GGS20DRAFT_594465 [Poronia punctata]